MRAQLLKQTSSSLLENRESLALVDLEEPCPDEDEVLIRVSACGVCHTELDEIENRTPPPVLPVIPGHQVVGVVHRKGSRVSGLNCGDRVGAAWIYSACGRCSLCLSGRENLCHSFQATGRDVNGGYAEYMKIPARFVYRIPEYFTDVKAAPLLCAGAIGYRSLRLTGIKDGQKLGLVGFGASAHLVLKAVRFKFPNTEVYIFARNKREREFGLELGAVWAGDITDVPPEHLDSVIDTTPAWKPVLAGLKVLAPGGRLVINAIRKEEDDKNLLSGLDYSAHLWLEKEIKSVANVTRKDVREFLDLAAEMKLDPTVQTFPLEEANQALLELKSGRVKGAKVLRIFG